MSKITNNGLTLSGTGCFIAVPIWQQWAPTVTVVGRSDHVRWLVRNNSCWLHYTTVLL